MKEIKFPCELNVEFREVGGEIEIVPIAYYNVASEGIEVRRLILLELSNAEQAQMKNFAKKTVLPRIKEHEGIA